MKNCDYAGNLQEDIKTATSKFNIKKFCNSVLWSFFTSLGISAIACIASSASFNLFLFCTMGLTSIGALGDLFDTIEYTKRRAKYATSKLCDLYTDINLNYNDRDLAEARMKDCIYESHIDQEAHTYKEGKEIKKEQKIITDFYLLDTQKKLQVLRQVRNVIIEGKKKIEDCDLYLLEDEDIKEENLKIPVQKTKKIK